MTWAALAILTAVVVIVIVLLGRVFIDLLHHTFPRLFDTVKPEPFEDEDDRWHWGIK